MSNLIHDITKAAGRHKRAQRIGRGEGSKGKTSGRGQKGAGSRAGSSKRIGFEGGQTEVYRRFPLRGFSNKPFETKYHVINLADLERFDEGATVDQNALKEAGLVSNSHQGVKVLGNGTLGRRLTVIAAAFSRSAHKAITDAGGQAQDTNGQPYQFREPKNRRQGRKLDKRLAALGLPPRDQPAEEGGRRRKVVDEAKGGKGGGKAEAQPKAGKDKKEGKPRQKPAVEAEAPTSGSSGDVTSAPESGDKDTAAAPRGKARQSEAPTEATENGDTD